MVNAKKKTSFFAILAYLLAVLFLIGGLLLPFGNQGTDYETIDFKNSLAMQLIPALNTVVKAVTGNAEDLIPMEDLAFRYSYPVSINAMENLTFDLGACLLLAYAVVTVLALLSILLVIALRKKRTGYRVATFMESLALLTTVPLLLVQMILFSIGGAHGDGTIWSLALIVAVVGPLAMLMFHSFSNGFFSGIMKTILATLAILSVVLCVFPANDLINLANPIPLVKDGNYEFINWTNAWTEAEGNVYTNLAGVYLRPGTLIGQIYALFSSYQIGMNYGDFLNANPNETVGKVACILMLVLGLIVLINMFLSIFGLGKKTNKFMLISNIVRYGVQLIITVVAMIIGAGVLKLEAGWMAYLLIVFAFLHIVMNVIRIANLPAKVVHTAPKHDPKTAKIIAEAEATAKGVKTKDQLRDEKARKKQEKENNRVFATAPAPAPAAETREQVVPEYNEPTESVFNIERKATAGGAASQALLEKELQAQGGTGEYYSPVIYNGPVDSFIETLNSDERVEFSKIFIEHKSTVNLAGIPEYEIDGDNTRFFNSVFIRFSRLKPHVSEGLMRKIYDRVSKMRG